jgi:hypothetical protein
MEELMYIRQYVVDPDDGPEEVADLGDNLGDDAEASPAIDDLS